MARAAATTAQQELSGGVVLPQMGQLMVLKSRSLFWILSSVPPQLIDSEYPRSADQFPDLKMPLRPGRRGPCHLPSSSVSTR